HIRGEWRVIPASDVRSGLQEGGALDAWFWTAETIPFRVTSMVPARAAERIRSSRQGLAAPGSRPSWTATGRRRTKRRATHARPTSGASLLTPPLLRTAGYSARLNAKHGRAKPT